MADPALGSGGALDHDAVPALDARVRSVVAALREERRVTFGEHVGVTTAHPSAGVPAGVRRVSVVIDVDRPDGAPPAPDARPGAPLAFAGGRVLPPLLFATSRAGLEHNIGEAESGRVLAAIREAGMGVFDDLPVDPLDPARALALVREQLRARPALRGVVLVGGYDVVPSQRVDCLPATLRASLEPTGDLDDFIVWSDDGYGQAETGAIPVTRVPDGASAELLNAVLAAGDVRRGATRRGVRNIARPFADAVFAGLPGAEGLLVSELATPATVPPLDADRVYLMLHGAVEDARRFWGEDSVGNGFIEAVDLTNVPRPAARVVFTGCCWGALTVDEAANDLVPGVAPSPRRSTSSIALRFLEHGATAFVGCTGAHYSPTREPFGYFGGPMHRSFWSALNQGKAPAEALFAAKADFVRDFPHGRSSEAQHAIEYKILHEYTCLGLGW